MKPSLKLQLPCNRNPSGPGSNAPSSTSCAKYVISFANFYPIPKVDGMASSLSVSRTIHILSIMRLLFLQYPNLLLFGALYKNEDVPPLKKQGTLPLTFAPSAAVKFPPKLKSDELLSSSHIDVIPGSWKHLADEKWRGSFLLCFTRIRHSRNALEIGKKLFLEDMSPYARKVRFADRVSATFDRSHADDSVIALDDVLRCLHTRVQNTTAFFKTLFPVVIIVL